MLRSATFCPARGSLALSLCLLFLDAAGVRADPPPPLKDVTAAVRTRVDRLAMQQPLESLRQEKVRVLGNISLWAIDRLALPAEDEAKHAQDTHKRILQQYRSVETPPDAEQVFGKLVAALPPEQKPESFRFTLTVLDLPEPASFTCGGGMVYVSRSLLDALWSDKQRGETALAFVLGHELGHTCLLHCRRGWLVVEVNDEIKRGIELNIEADVLRQVLETTVDATSAGTRFLYTRLQTYEADLFAYQACRNAGLAINPALDAVRWQSVLEQPRLLTGEEARADNGPPAEKRDQPTALQRLHRLLMERDGLVDDEEKYGLFLYDPHSDDCQRCRSKSLGAGERPIIFVHGFRGSLHTFRDYLKYYSEQAELKDRKLLVFRYPNNESLARCGLFLSHEVQRVLAAPDKAFFVCHSAGGLVFRYYAEVQKGGFDRADILATPHEGTSLTTLRYLVNLGAFATELRLGGPGALARMLPEGKGQITYDLQPDSLFLRYLGHNAALARRYHVFAGDCLGRLELFGVRTAVTAAKRVMMERILPEIRSSVVRRLAMQRVGEWRVPPEIAHGDLIVSERSALLKDAGQATRTRLNHDEFTTNDQVIREVLQDILQK
jgi:pimeloyl-ACP methyl ester carboxylesterase